LAIAVSGKRGANATKVIDFEDLDRTDGFPIISRAGCDSLCSSYSNLSNFNGDGIEDFVVLPEGLIQAVRITLAKPM